MYTPQMNSHHIVVLSLMATGLRQTVSSMKVFMIILSSEKTLTNPRTNCVQTVPRTNSAALSNL